VDEVARSHYCSGLDGLTVRTSTMAMDYDGLYPIEHSKGSFMGALVSCPVILPIPQHKLQVRARTTRLLIPVLASVIHDPAQLFLEPKVLYILFSNYFLLQTVVRTDLFTSTAEQVSIDEYTSTSDISLFTWSILIHLLDWPPASLTPLIPPYTAPVSN
ncbi:uncharacterized protein F5891DRAFT_953112, partial [Suillus fuscotomentosus]